MYFLTGVFVVAVMCMFGRECVLTYECALGRSLFWYERLYVRECICWCGVCSDLHCVLLQ